MNDIKFTKTNGGLARTAASEDPISGLVLFNLTGTGESSTPFVFGTEDGQIKGFEAVTVGNETAYVKKFTFAEQLEECGIEYEKYEDTALSELQKAKNFVHYHISEFFRMNAGGTVYLMLANSDVSVDAIAVLQNYANGRLRQIGVMTNGDNAAAYQLALTEMEANHKPASLVLTKSGKNVELATLTGTSLETAGRCNVSELIGCDFDVTKVNELGDYAYFGCLGTLLGAISKASVNESIAWVQKFPLGFESPALTNGNLIKNVSEGNQDLLNANRYIFVRTYVGDADCYFNDSHTEDSVTSDYAFIENVRTIDKACRGIRKNLLPYMNSPMKVDSQTGKLDPTTVSYLQSIASDALTDMEKVGEISGYSVEIDPDQNVLATSELEIIVKKVPVGVIRKMNVKIGYTTKL